MRTIRTAWVFGVLGVFAMATVQADIVLNDSFSDASRANQSLPDSARWASMRATADAYVSSDGLLVGTNNTSGTGFLSYFAQPQLTLSIGQSVQLSFDYQFAATNHGDGTFRVNLFNSGGVRTTNDNTGFNNAVFNGWTGYGFAGQFGTNGALRYRVVERSIAANNLLSGAAYSIGNSAVQTNGSQVATWYTATLTLDYLSASSMRYTANLAGQTLSATDTVSLVTSFDAVSISGGANGWMAVDNVTVTVVPEPSVALLLTSGLLAFGLLRRRS